MHPAMPTPVPYLTKLSYLDERLKTFNQLIGSWPTPLESPAMAQEVKALLEQDLQHAVALYQEHPQEIGAKLVLADLLRMGHNIDLPDCAQRADAVLDEIFRMELFNVKAMLCRASMYVTLHPRLMPDAERLFAKVLELTGTNADPIVYKGLAFACLGQDKHPQGIAHLEAYVQRAPTDKPMLELLEKLKSGGKLTSHYYASGAPPEPQTDVATPSWMTQTKGSPSTPGNAKPWWRLW